MSKLQITSEKDYLMGTFCIIITITESPLFMKEIAEMTAGL